ncbi:MAG: flagellar protein FliS [Alphaproteobacteria bacterium]|nr:flagellar protein FliS [Alphaproteobacteria bacterium]
MMYKKVEKMYKKQVQIVTGSTEQVAFLFEQAASSLLLARGFYDRQDYQMYASEIQRCTNIVVGLSGVLNPEDGSNDVEQTHQSLASDDAPWDRYFSVILYSINQLCVEFEAASYDRLIASLQNMAKLWQERSLLTASVSGGVAAPTEQMDMRC